MDPPNGIIVSPSISATIGDRSVIDETKEYESWNANDSIGIFMMYSGLPLEQKNIHVAGNNKIYKSLDGTNQLVAAGNNQSLLFPSHNDKVDFYAYRPYISNLTNFKYPILLNNQQKQNKIDLLTAREAKNHSLEKAEVNLVFDHQLSKLHFKITTSQGIPLKGLRIFLEGFSTQAEFSLLDQKISNLSKIGSILAFTESNGRNGEAIILPEPTSNNRSVKIILSDGTEKTFLISSAQKFEKGKRTIFNVRINSSPAAEFNTITESWDGTLLANNAPTYKLLDGFKDEDGNVIGMVVSVDATGRSGLVLSLDEKRGQWSTAAGKSITLGVKGTETKEDMQAVIESKGGANWKTLFPAFEWSNSLAGGKWYIPVNSDFEMIRAIYNKDKVAFNKKLVELGGKPIVDSEINSDAYWSATATPGVGINAYKFGNNGTFIKPVDRDWNRNMRAVLSF